MAKSGDTGWDELQKCGGKVDAALSTLDEAQVRLSLEFNKTCRLAEAGKSGPSRKNHAPYHASLRKTAAGAHHPAKTSPARGQPTILPRFLFPWITAFHAVRSPR